MKPGRFWLAAAPHADAAFRPVQRWGRRVDTSRFARTPRSFYHGEHREPTAARGGSSNGWSLRSQLGFPSWAFPFGSAAKMLDGPVPPSGKSGERRAAHSPPSWHGSTGPPGPVRWILEMKIVCEEYERRHERSVPDRVARSSRAMTAEVDAETRSPDCPGPSVGRRGSRCSPC